MPNAGGVTINTANNGASFTGAVVINSGVLVFGNHSLGDGSASITFGGNSTLRWDTANTQDISNKSLSSTGFTGTLDLQTNNVTFATTNGLTGTGNFTKTGTGTTTTGILTLAAASNFSGTYTASAATFGTTLLKNANALQNASVTPTSTAAAPSGGITFDSTVGGTFTFGNLTGAGNLGLIDNAGSPAPITLNVGNNNASPASYTGILSGGGILNKIGTGTTTLGGANTFSGGLNIKSGTLSGATSASAFGPNTINLGDSSGSANATLNGALTGTFANAISVTSGNSGVARISSTAASIFSGAVTLNAHDLTLAPGNAALNISGGITGAGNLTLASTGTGALTLQTVTINNTGTITNSGSGSGGAIISAVIGTNVLGVAQSSTTSALTLSGANTFSSGVTLNTGGLTLSNVAGLGTGTFTINGGSFTGSGINAGVVANPVVFNGDFTYAGGGSSGFQVTFGTGAITVTANTQITANSQAITFNGAITNNGFNISKIGAGSVTLNGAISGTGAVSVNGGGLTLGGTSNFSGGVNLNAGGLTITSDTALGLGGTWTIAGGTSFLAATPSKLNTNNNPMVWNGNFTDTAANSAHAYNMGTGAVTLGANVAITVNSQTLTVGGTVTGGAFNLSKVGPATTGTPHLHRRHHHHRRRLLADRHPQPKRREHPGQCHRQWWQHRPSRGQHHRHRHRHQRQHHPFRRQHHRCHHPHLRHPQRQQRRRPRHRPAHHRRRHAQQQHRRGDHQHRQQRPELERRFQPSPAPSPSTSAPAPSP